MPNLMVALPNIGGALCSTPQSLADAHYRCRAVTLPKIKKQDENIMVCRITYGDHNKLNPGLVTSYDLRPGNGVGLFWEKGKGCLSLPFSPRIVPLRFQAGGRRMQ